MEDYVKKGYLPSGLNNFVALLGWNPGDGNTKELFSSAELISNFSLERVNKGGAVVDRDKLFWMNGEHIRIMVANDMDEFMAMVVPFIQTYFQDTRGMSGSASLNVLGYCTPSATNAEHAEHAEVANDAEEKELATEVREDNIYLHQCITLVSQRARTLVEFGPLIEYFFVEPLYMDTQVKQKMWNIRPAGLLEAALDIMKEDDFTSNSKLKKKFQSLLKMEKYNTCKMKDLFLPLRYAVSGTTVGADLMETIMLLGQEKCVHRLKEVLLKDE